MSYRGDIRLGQTADFKFTTRRFSTGAPFTLAGSPVVSAYVGNSVTQITAGITLSVDFDSVTGLNNIRIVASTGNGYATATDVSLVITTGTVDSVSVVGEEVASFSIENRSALMPTTAARTLAVDASNKAPATIAAGDMAASSITASAIATGALDRDAFAADTGLQSIRSGTAQAGGASNITLDASASAVNDFYLGTSVLTTGGTGAGQFRIITDYVGATKVATVDLAWITTPDSTTTFALFPSTAGAAEIAATVWDLATSGHTTAGTFGEQLKTDVDAILVAVAASAIRTAVGLASANLDTQLGDLPTNAELATSQGTSDDATLAAIAALNNLSSAQVQTAAGTAITAAALATAANLTLVDTVVDAIKVKTDSLTFTSAGLVDSNVQSVNDVLLQGAGVSGNKWRPA
jgi:hypothetical protein